MGILGEKFIMDDNGKRTGVIISMEDYRRILEELEELDSIRAYDAAKASADEAVPFDRAVAEIEVMQK